MPKIELPTFQLEQALEQITEAESAISAAGTHLRLAISELGQHTGDNDDTTTPGNDDDGSQT